MERIINDLSNQANTMRTEAKEIVKSALRNRNIPVFARKHLTVSNKETTNAGK